MPEQILHRADVIARLQQMRRKRMPQRVRRHLLRQTRPPRRRFHRPLQIILLQMMPPQNRFGEHRRPACRFGRPARIRANGHSFPFLRQMFLERLTQRLRQNGDPILAAFASADDDLAPCKINVFDAQPQQFEPPQAAV